MILMKEVFLWRSTHMSRGDQTTARDIERDGKD